MLESLDRIDRFSKKLDRLLGAEVERPEGLLAWSQATVLHEYADRPVEFFREVLGTELWSKQQEIADSVRQHRRTAARSGHKVGKSRLAAGLALWWVCTRPSARVILTAPTSRQVKKALWYEIKRYWATSPDLRRLVPEPALAPETGCRWADGRELFGFTAKNADAVSGPGGPEVLVIIDEGSGVPREVWEALQGIRAGGGRVLALGNPTQTSGWFFDAFNERRAGWVLFKISSEESPNVVERRTVIPGLADQDFIAEIAADYDTESPTYAVRVRGDFPSMVANAVIGLGHVELAREAWDDEEITDDCDAVDIGVDVARFGDDDSAVSGRRGQRLYPPAYFEREHDVRAIVNGYDSVRVAAMAVQCLKALRKPGERARIKVDVTGGFGEPVVAMLLAQQELGELDTDVAIIAVNFAGESSNPEKYPVVRDELWFGGRFFFRDGGAMYPDPRCESELIAPTYAPDLKGRNKVEKKRDTKKRLGRSPDRADSVLLAMYEPPIVAVDDSWVDAATPMTRWDQGSRGFG